MRLSLAPDDLAGYTSALIRNYFPDDFQPPKKLNSLVRQAIERIEYCFDKIHLKYYRDQDGTRFDHMNADHMASYLWFLGNSVWKETGDEQLPTRLSYLNKIMHGLDLFHFVELPSIFLLLHPVGTVIGRASFDDYLLISQNCTIGDAGSAFPTFGRGALLNSGCSVLGDCKVGDEVIFGANSFILDTNIPDKSVVLGRFPDHRLIPNKQTAPESHFFERGLPKHKSAHTDFGDSR